MLEVTACFMVVKLIVLKRAALGKFNVLTAVTCPT
jgi:hypothetical protein